MPNTVERHTQISTLIPNVQVLIGGISFIAMYVAYRLYRERHNHER